MITIHQSKDEKIHSVRKDRRFKEHLEKRGFFQNLDKIRFKVNEEDNGIERYLKFKAAVNRYIKKEVGSVKSEKLNEFIEKEINGEYRNIKIRFIEKDEKDPIVRLRLDIIKEFLKNEHMSDEKMHTAFSPVKLISDSEDGELELVGYSLLNKTIPKNRHGKHYYPKKDSFIHQMYYRHFVNDSKYQRAYCYAHLCDFVSELSEVFMANALLKFLKNNLEVLRYNLVKECIKTESRYVYDEPSVLLKDENGIPYYKHTIVHRTYCMVPRNEEYQRDFEKYLDKYFPEITDRQPAGYVDETKGFFYGNSLPKFDEDDAKKSDSIFVHLEAPNAFYKELTAQLERIRQDAEEEEETEKADYAKSFQTKQHINKETQKVMEDNEFLTNFGYVELDNEVDLKKFQKVQKDFAELRNVFFIPFDKKHSFRIKKLGKHRASGLYVPGFRSTIVDLDGINSFVHEVGHQIDYIFSRKGYRLSEQAEFRRIADRSKEIANAFVRTLDETDGFRMKWEKGQKHYFNNPKEIFARSYEIYANLKGITSSLVKTLPKDNFLYPFEEDYTKMVTEYFDNLIDTLKEEK